MANRIHDLKDKNNHQRLVLEAAKCLERGGVIAIPTDTIYGIAASADVDYAVGRIYQIKKRERLKPIAVCVSSIYDIYKIGKITVSKELLSNLLPGPVTVVFEKLKYDREFNFFDEQKNVAEDYAIINDNNYTISTIDTINIPTIDNKNNSTIDTINNSTIYIKNNSTIDRINNSSIDTINNSTIDIKNNSTINRINNSSIEMINKSTIDTINYSTMDTINNSSIDIKNNPTINKINNSSIDTIYNSTIDTINYSTINRINNLTKDTINNSTIDTMNKSNIDITNTNCRRMNRKRGDFLENSDPENLTYELSPMLNGHTNLIGIRLPDDGFVKDLCRVHRRPIALTSANISTMPSPIKIQDFSSIWSQIDLIFDNGPIACHNFDTSGSTVVDLSRAGQFKIIRNGCSLEETRQILFNAGLKESCQ